MSTNLGGGFFGEGVAFGPEFRCAAELLVVGLVHVGDFCVLWIAWLSRAEQRLEGEEGSLDGQGRRPLVFENVETNGTGLRRDIWMPH
jgi:hypothetical protein